MKQKIYIVRYITIILIMALFVDLNTLQPNFDCYSELRDSFIKVSSKEDIKRIKLEEQVSIRIIEEHLFHQTQAQLNKAKEIIKIKKKTTM